MKKAITSGKRYGNNIPCDKPIINSHLLYFNHLNNDDLLKEYEFNGYKHSTWECDSMLDLIKHRNIPLFLIPTSISKRKKYVQCLKSAGKSEEQIKWHLQLHRVTIETVQSNSLRNFFEKVNTIIKCILGLIFLILLFLWITRDSTYNRKSFHGYECLENCSGHESGYEWAEENDIQDIDDCVGNSNSFIEGCQAYVNENY